MIVVNIISGIITEEELERENVGFNGHLMIFFFCFGKACLT